MASFVVQSVRTRCRINPAYGVMAIHRDMLRCGHTTATRARCAEAGLKTLTARVRSTWCVGMTVTPFCASIAVGAGGVLVAFVRRRARISTHNLSPTFSGAAEFEWCES